MIGNRLEKSFKRLNKAISKMPKSIALEETSKPEQRAETLRRFGLSRRTSRSVDLELGPEVRKPQYIRG